MTENGGWSKGWQAVRGDERSPWPALIALMVVAAALRSIALDQQLWFDELLTLLDSVRNPAKQILGTYAQSQHTLYSLMARPAILTFGEHPWVLRLPAVLFGVATVPALYFCARELTTRRESFLACMLLTVSYHHVWFSQNARGYTGLVFFTLLATYFFIRGVRETRFRAWTGYALSVALGGLVHLTMGFVTIGHGLVYLWMLAARRNELRQSAGSFLRPLTGFALAGALTVLLYAPAMHQVFTVTAEKGATRWSNPMYLVAETLKGLSAGAGGGLVVVALGAIVLLAGLGSFWRQDPFGVGLMVAPGLVVGASMLVLAHQQPRFFFFAIGFGFLLLIRGAMVCGQFVAHRLRRGKTEQERWGVIIVALMLAASVWSLRPAYIYPKQDFEGAMAYVDAHRRSGEPVVAAGLAALPYRRYYGRDWLPAETATQLEAARVPGRQTWLVYTLPVFQRWLHPELWNAIQGEFDTVRVFRGTMSGGEVFVCKSKIIGKKAVERER